MRTLVNILFPGFSIHSVTFFFVSGLISIYLLQVAAFALFHTSSWACFLYHLGAKYTFAIARQYQLWRLIAPIFLHSSFGHLAGNVISLLMAGF